MTDERMHKLIQAELAGEIGMEEEAELQQALAENPELAAVYREEQKLSALFKEDRRMIGSPVGLATRIADRVLEEAPRGRRFDLQAWARRLSVAAALFLVVGLSFWSGRQSTSATPEKGQAGLIERRDELLLNHPEANREQIFQLFDQALTRLAEADQRHQTDLGRIMEELESEVTKVLGKSRKR